MTYQPERPTERQRAVLHRILEHLPYEEVEILTKEQAHRIIAGHARDWRDFPATPRQEVFLRNWGRWRERMRRGEAADRIAAIKARIARLSPEEVDEERRAALNAFVGNPW